MNYLITKKYDTFSEIAAKYYNNTGKWLDIYNYNSKAVSGFGPIPAGTVIYLPPNLDSMLTTKSGLLQEMGPSWEPTPIPQAPSLPEPVIPQRSGIMQHIQAMPQLTKLAVTFGVGIAAFMVIQKMGKKQGVEA